MQESSCKLAGWLIAQKQKFSEREAAKPGHTGGSPDSDVSLSFDIFLRPNVFITAPKQTFKQAGLCVSSHMGLKCWRVSMSVLVFPAASETYVHTLSLSFLVCHTYSSFPSVLSVWLFCLFRGRGKLQLTVKKYDKYCMLTTQQTTSHRPFNTFVLVSHSLNLLQFYISLFICFVYLMRLYNILVITEAVDVLFVIIALNFFFKRETMYQVIIWFDSWKVYLI